MSPHMCANAQEFVCRLALSTNVDFLRFLLFIFSSSSYRVVACFPAPTALEQFFSAATACVCVECALVFFHIIFRRDQNRLLNKAGRVFLAELGFISVFFFFIIFINVFEYFSCGFTLIVIIDIDKGYFGLTALTSCGKKLRICFYLFKTSHIYTYEMYFGRLQMAKIFN